MPVAVGAFTLTGVLLHSIYFYFLPMTWLPSFVKLFLLLVLGFVLQLGGSMAAIGSIGNYALSSLFAYASLLGLFLIVVSLLLMGLKFFAQLDRNAK